jgi:hypothetical protein
MNYIPYIITDDSITVVVKGKPYTIASSNAAFNEVKTRLQNEDFDGIEKLFDTGAAITSFTKGSIVIKDNAVYYKGQVVHNYLVDRILAFMREGLPHKPLVAFLENLLQNPSFRAVQELYAFLEAANLPITEDGCFLAYRKVTSDYKDFYTGKNDNSIGAVVKMARNMVDEDKNRTCSYGLHFCSHSYLPCYHGGQGRVVIVKINPANVIAIPADYNNAKGRCCEYEVVADCAGHDAGQAFGSCVRVRGAEVAPVEVEVHAELVNEDSYDEDGQASYDIGRSAGAEAYSWGLSRDAEGAFQSASDADCSLNEDAFIDGYHDGYDEASYKALNTREKLSRIASSAKRGPDGRFVK